MKGSIPPDTFDPNEVATFGKSEDSRSFDRAAETEPAAPAAAAPADQGEQAGRDDEKPVPVKRFNRVFRERMEYKERLEEAETELERFRSTHAPATTQSRVATAAGDQPSWWTKLYGADANAQQGWQVYQEATASQQQAMIDRTLEAVREQQATDRSANARNEEELDESMDDLQETLGVTLSASAQEEVLDLADEFTPKDDEGKYVGGRPMPFEKAYDLYLLKHPAGVASRQATQRRQIASLTGSSGSGSAPSAGSSLPPLQPGNWGQWRQHFR
jgi:hypothetical protein